MTLVRGTLLLLGKELRLEFRTRELLHTSFIFVLMVVVLFSFAFEPTAAESRRIAPGLLWTAFLFAASLMLHPLFTRERAAETLDALRMAPLEPYAILLGKILANLLYLLLVELITLPVFAVLYNVRVTPVLPQLVLVLLLGSLGICATGTFFSAISTQARLRELLLPLLMLPVLTPVLIASVECTASLLGDDALLPRGWLQFLAAFDIIFLSAGYLLCETLFEE